MYNDPEKGWVRKVNGVKTSIPKTDKRKQITEKGMKINKEKEIRRWRDKKKNVGNMQQKRDRG